MPTPPPNPTPDQLARWLADARDALREAADPLRLWGVIESGRATAPQKRRLVGRLIEGARGKLSSVSTWLAENVRSGKATLAGWFRDFAGIMAPNVYAAAFAVLGTINPAPLDIKAADRQVIRQVAYLAGFRDAIANGSQPIWAVAAQARNPAIAVPGAPPLPPGWPSGVSRPGQAGQSQGKQPQPPPPVAPRFLQRSEMYADSAWGAAEGVFREKMGRDGYTHERRRLGSNENHCETCPRLARMGWQPYGSLPAIGNSPCRVKCHCWMEFGHQNMISEIISPLADPVADRDPTPRRKLRLIRSA